MKKILFIAFIATQIGFNIQASAVPKLIKAGLFYAAGTWLFGETLLDGGHRYLQYKTIIQEYRWALLKDSEGHLSKNELNICAIIQGISNIPKIFWREMLAGALSLYLFYLGTKSLLESEPPINQEDLEVVTNN